jgi:hypothetical protein
MAEGDRQGNPIQHVMPVLATGIHAFAEKDVGGRVWRGHDGRN